MTQSYLEHFRSTLPKVQGNQVLKRLIQKKNSGEIRTLGEFKNDLKALTKTLVTDRITPTFKLYEGIVGKDISSEQYNEMLERIEDDLTTAFTEADNIDTISDTHFNLIQDVALKALRLSLNELEAKVTLHEYISSTNYGFDDALFDTFRETTKNTTSRNSEVSSIVYFDPRQSVLVESDCDSKIDIASEQLVIGTSNEYFITCKSVDWLCNQYSQRGEIDVSLPDSSIFNLIDKTRNTFWTTSLLFSSPKKSGAYMELCVHLPSAQNVNFVEIEPVIEFPLHLTQVDYLDANGTRSTLSSHETVISGSAKVYFKRITAQAIVLRFRQPNYQEVQFTPKLGVSNASRALTAGKYLSVDLDSIREDLDDILNSSFVRNDLLGLPTKSQTLQRYYQYMFGFDNIKPGYAVFNDQSIFVAKSKSVSQLGVVGLTSKEQRPVQTQGETSIALASFTYPTHSVTEDTKIYHSSIEYWLTVQQFTTDNYLIATDTIPLLPIGATRVYHERLILSEKTSSTLYYNNLGSLMHYCAADSADVKIYRNGEEIHYLYGWQFADAASYPTITVESSNSGSRMRRGVYILGEVNSLDIYTVSYTPTVSTGYLKPKIGSSLSSIVDLSGDEAIRITRDNIIVFDSIRKSHTVDRVEVYLTTIFRRNTAHEYASPVLDEFMLLTGSRNTKKYE